MRNAILQVPETRTANERRQVLRAAIRQLDRAEIYLAAVAYMSPDDRGAQQAVSRLRTDVESLRRHLGGVRNSLSK